MGQFAVHSDAFGHGHDIPRRHNFFRLYALDTELHLGVGARRGELERAMSGHVLATAEVMGRYER